jgi:hypothetical protein
MDNRRKILEMLAEKKISVDEAERLIALIQSDSSPGENKERKIPPRYLRVLIKPTTSGTKPGECENVNIRVPMALLRAGIKLASIIPPSAYNQMDSALKEKGIEFDLRSIKPENIDELIAAFDDLEVNIQSDKQDVRIYAE